MNLLEKIGNDIARYFFWFAGAAIVAMMLITCADVVLRYFRRPVPGTYELVCFLGAMAVAFAMAHTSVQKGHVAVSVVILLFPPRIQFLIESITSCLSLAFFGVIGWQSFLYANNLRASGEVSLTLELPFYPFVYGVGLSAVAVCLILLASLIKNVAKVFEK